MRKDGFDNFKVELNHQRKGRERTNEKLSHPNVSQIDLLECFKSIAGPDTFPAYQLCHFQIVFELFSSGKPSHSQIPP